MEYDNDRLRKRRPKVETFYWIMLILLQPVTGWLSSPYRWTWPFLLTANLLVFPAYVVYSRILGQSLGIRGRKWFPILLSLSSFLVIQAFLMGVYALCGKIASGPLKDYFALTPSNVLRNCWWTAVNMAFSIAVFYIRKADDEQDQLVEMQKDNTFFRLRYL